MNNFVKPLKYHFNLRLLIILITLTAPQIKAELQSSDCPGPGCPAHSGSHGSWGLKDFDPTNKNSRLREGVKQFDPTRNPHFRNATGSSSVDFYIYNKCIRSNINVKVEYMPNNMRRFQTRNYILRRNEKAFLFKTDNKYVYVTAKSVDNKNRLNDLFQWDRQRVDTGRNSRFTRSFSCN